MSGKPSITRVVKFIRKGDKGDNAINIVVTNETVVFTKVGQSQKIYVEVYDGQTQIEYGSSGAGFLCSTLTEEGQNFHYICGGKVYWGFGTDGNRFYYKVRLIEKADFNVEMPFTVTHNNIGYNRSINFSTAYDGKQGPTLRGPQAWSDCAVGYNFQAGGEDEEYKDVVLYNGNYYSCIKSHTKTESNYPTSTTDTNTGLWKLGDKIELVATKILLATYALVKNLGVEAIDMKDANGNILFQAKDGVVTCKTGNFDNVNIQSGKIAGFKISGNGLTNDPFTNDAYIIFRNDAHNCFAGIGGNVLPATSGARAVARFENEDKNDWWGLGHNVAMLLSAKNSDYNHAFVGEGNGTLKGWIGGYLLSKFSCTTKNTIYDGYVTLKTNNRWLVYSSVDSSGVALPKLSQVRSALYIGTGVAFCVKLTICADLNTKDFSIYGRNKIKDSNNAYPWNTTELPVMTHWNNGRYDSLAMGAGDSVTFLLVYDPSKSDSMDDFSLYYTARIINRQN